MRGEADIEVLSGGLLSPSLARGHQWGPGGPGLHPFILPCLQPWAQGEEELPPDMGSSPNVEHLFGSSYPGIFRGFARPSGPLSWAGECFLFGYPDFKAFRPGLIQDPLGSPCPTQGTKELPGR